MKTIYVYENWLKETPTLIGRLYVETVRGIESYAFEYDEKWLANSKALILDPDLSLYKGRQYPIDKRNFGLFADSCPDRWGRVLMKRRERILAHKENRKPRNLLESDYLLGVYDETRMGALRFSLEEGGEFLSNDKETAAPPWTTLRTLENASREFEKDELSLSDKWLNQLIKPGSSLGGARPKATVQDPNGELWIAKFPSKHDDVDSGAWEKVVHDLARMCGLNVPPSKLERFSKTGSTFLVKRFDRAGKRRIHFSSAMTMLGKTDGSSAVDGDGYLDIVSFIKSNGAAAKEDLIELWKRVVFNMAVSNTDDHLRNHGFIMGKEGWILSPLYDVNPSIYGDTLSLNVDSDSNLIDFNLALSVAKMFDLSETQAIGELKEIKCIVDGNWRKIAQQYSLSRSEIEGMSPAFDMAFKE